MASSVSGQPKITKTKQTSPPWHVHCWLLLEDSQHAAITVQEEEPACSFANWSVCVGGYHIFNLRTQDSLSPVAVASEPQRGLLQATAYGQAPGTAQAAKGH